MTRPTISVIISTYNRKGLLKKAIKSVLNQSFKNFELIIVDDCSTDGTGKLQDFEDERVKYFKTEKNSGHDGLPKNIGIQQAQGKYITFLDDDDQYRTDALKILYKYIVGSGADVVYGDYLIQDYTKGGKLSAGWSLDFDVGLLTQMNYISMVTVIIKRDCLLEVGGFDESVPKFKDWNLWLRLQKRGYRFMHIPIIMAEVSTQQDSISHKVENDKDEAGRNLPTFFNPADCEIYATKTIFGAKKPLSVAIITLTKDRLEYTKKMSTSLRLAGYKYDWFVIDQASTDGTVEWIKTHQGIKAYQLNKENTGVAGGWNNALDLVIKIGKYDIIMKVDNDAEMMSEDWLKTIVDIYDRNRTLILSPYVEGLEDAPGGVLRQRQGQGQSYVLINDHVLGIVPFVGGIALAAPVEAYRDFRFESGFMQGNKDYMFCQYARSIGFNPFYVEELKVWHIDGTIGQKKKYPAYFLEGEILIQTKNEIRK